jgi:Ca2+-binding RTX toxin-like protein
MFETLESRRLLTATTFSDGVNAVMGSGSTLQINAPVAGSNLAVLEVNHTVSVQDVTTQQSVVFANVLHIKMTGNRGADRICYNGSTIGASIATGGGNDDVTLLDSGAVSSTVNTAAGDDQITIIFSHAANIDAGANNDAIFINIGAGYDFSSTAIKVDAGGGSDTIYAYAGNSTLYGGNGSDTLHNLTAGFGSVIYSKFESVLSS